LRSALLLIHALCGALWVLASLCMALAGASSLMEGEAGEDFARKVVPVLNWLASGAAVLLLCSGLGNLVVAGQARHFRFSSTFKEILGAKLTLFALMALALWTAWRVQARLLAKHVSAPAGNAMKLLIGLAGATALLGAIALALGLWLVGS
jgi:hypothetical protein